MTIHLRLETPEDHHAVETLTREAFWGPWNWTPTCDEHYLVHLLRSSPSFVAELDYVAEADGRLVGNILYTRAKIIAPGGGESEILTFGPLSVLPAYWGKGVGSALMRHTIAEARRLGHRTIAVYGHPDYYPRFGFRPAEAFGITTPDGESFDALMAMPLYDGALSGLSGAFHEDNAFTIDAKAAKAYDRGFPSKEPAVLFPIEPLLDMLEPAARKAFVDRGIETLSWLTRLSGREIAAWEGIDRQAMESINRELVLHGFAGKRFPSSC